MEHLGKRALRLLGLLGCGEIGIPMVNHLQDSEHAFLGGLGEHVAVAVFRRIDGELYAVSENLVEMLALFEAELTFLFGLADRPDVEKVDTGHAFNLRDHAAELFRGEAHAFRIGHRVFLVFVHTVVFPWF